MEYSNIDIGGCVCCDDCCEIISNSFNCPICNAWENLSCSENLDYETTEIECENCNSKFKKHEEDKDESWYYIDRLILVEKE